MKRWLNVELTKSEWEKTRVFLKNHSIKYEASGCGVNIHIEVYVNSYETNIVNDFLNTL